jgi:hypothetical protein
LGLFANKTGKKNFQSFSLQDAQKGDGDVQQPLSELKANGTWPWLEPNKAASAQPTTKNVIFDFDLCSDLSPV